MNDQEINVKMKAKEYLQGKGMIDPTDEFWMERYLSEMQMKDLVGFMEDYAKQEKESYLQKFRKYWNKFNARAFYITDEHIQKFKDES
jgi:hypothetical protein